MYSMAIDAIFSCMNYPRKYNVGYEWDYDSKKALYKFIEYTYNFLAKQLGIAEIEIEED